MNSRITIASLLIAAALVGCKEKTLPRDDVPGQSAASTAPAEEGPSCTVGAGSARTRMATGEDMVENKEGGSRLKTGDAPVPAKAEAPAAGAEAGNIPGAASAVEFEVKVKQGDDATREALDKILDKTPTVKP